MKQAAKNELLGHSYYPISRTFPKGLLLSLPYADKQWAHKGIFRNHLLKPLIHSMVWLCSSHTFPSQRFWEQVFPLHSSLVRARIIQAHTICQIKCTWKQMTIPSPPRMFTEASSFLRICRIGQLGIKTEQKPTKGSRERDSAKLPR